MQGAVQSYVDVADAVVSTYVSSPVSDDGHLAPDPMQMSMVGGNMLSRTRRQV
jgi:hypothetical protein